MKVMVHNMVKIGILEVIMADEVIYVKWNMYFIMKKETKTTAFEWASSEEVS
jgi:hypothetical protein